MNMDTLRFCPQCQQPLPANAPEGLCPQCLLAAAAAPPSEPQPVTTSGGDIPDIGDPLAVGKCLPQFEIIELLGRGGMGVVYKARQLNLDRIVALKILPPVDSQSADFVERFRREARSLAKLSHPNIVAVHDFGESGGLYYFAMEFVDGANLREMIRTGKMRPEEALAVVPKICDALQFAHEEGVVHRDVKPENILIDKRGRVKIADFGLAKLLRREQADHTLTMTGMTLGTPRYMAPEQLDKPETVDHRADIYSLGVVFYEMLTGEVPMGRFAPPSEKVRIDVRLDEIVLHALERDADRRYQHVSQVRDDVEKVTGKPQVTPAPSAATVPQSPNDEEDAEAEHSAFAEWGGRIIALNAVLLAFFNPWGTKAWFFFGAGCAIFGLLNSFGMGRRRISARGVEPSQHAEASSTPRLSRCALWGAIWAPFALCGLAVTVLMFPPREGAFADWIHGHPLGFAVSVGALTLIGVSAILGTSILGGVAVAKIRRSGGKLYGLRLALTDALLFPLLVLDFLVIATVSAVVMGLLFAAYPDGPRGNLQFKLPGMLTLIIGLPLAVWIDFLIVRRMWRAVTGQPDVAKSPAPVNETKTAAGEPNWIGRISLWTAIAGVVLPVLIALGAQMNLPVQRLAGVITLCFVLGGVLELAALVCGIIGRSTKSGKAGILIASGSLVMALLFYSLAAVHDIEASRTDTVTAEVGSQAIPPLGTITNGIGAEFTVPAGQVALFEIVTRKDNATVPVPPHYAYVLAGERAIAGTFRWSREPGQQGGLIRRWRIELVSGAGTGTTGGIALPEALDAMVDARGLGLGVLEPNEEAIHWGSADADNLPANGLIGLRVTTVAHNLKNAGQGISHTGWKGGQSVRSTTRRKLPEETGPAKGTLPAGPERNAALLGLAKQFNIEAGPSATDAEVRAMVADRIQQSPEVRTKIEQTLRDMGVPFSSDDKPSELLKKLEGIVQKLAD
jgi:predicted Ser/Thr protein kinase